MKRKAIDLSQEPRGAVYRRLLDHARSGCEYALLVVREEDWPPGGSSATAIEALSPFLVSSEKRSEWPGTVLIAGTATVFNYKLTDDSVGVLKREAEGLYDWSAPELPEDLCLLRADLSPWLVSIAHERDGYLQLSDDELVELLRSAPDLGDLIERVPIS